MWPSVIAVLGTLAGGTLTFVYQNHLAKQSREEARRDHLHADLLEACAALGAALVAYRHSQLARQKHRLRVRGGTSPELREEVRQRRGDAWAARFRVELLMADEAVIDAAATSMRSIRALKEVQDPDQLESDAEAARRSIYDFVRTARDRLLDPARA